MPQVFPAVAAWLAEIGTTYGVVAEEIATVLIYAAETYALNRATAALTKKGKSGAGAGLEVAEMNSTAAGRIIYGKIRISGVDVIPPLAAGVNGELLHEALAIAIHEVDGFTGCDVYLDDVQVAAADIGAVVNNSTSGAVSGSTKFAGSAWISRYTGSASQTVNWHLNHWFPTSFTSSFTGHGIAYCSMVYDWGKGKVFTGGVPNFATEIRGKRCYDPRLDPSPGNDPTNAAYIAWTENPALCWADFKMCTTYGQKCASSEIDWTCVVDAANICDALVAIPGLTTQKRYTFNGVLFTDADMWDNEKQFIDAMLGKLSYTDGKYRIFAGAWRSPVYEIDKEDWVSIGAIQTVAPRGDDRFNGVVCYHVDPERNWQRVESYRRYNDTYKAADAGERVWVELEQPHCTNKYQAERKSEFTLRQSRNGIKLSGKLPPRFMRLRTWDNVTLYFNELGWVAKTFTVTSASLNIDGSIDVTLIEEQSSDWTDLLAAEYGSPSVTPIPPTNPTNPSAPTPFSVTPLLATLQFDFTEPVTRPLGTRYQILRSPGTLAIASSYSVLWEGDTTRVILGADVRSDFWYHGRCVANSFYSPLDPSTYGIGARPWIGPEAMPGNRGYPDGELFFASNSYWTGQTLRASHSYYLVTSGGIQTQRGRLIIVTDSDAWSNGAGFAGISRIHPLRFDVNSRASFIAVPCFPGQSGTVMCLYRRATNITSGLFPQISIRTAPVSVNSPKATNFGSQIGASINVSGVSVVSGDWNVAIGSFTMPSSTIYDAITLALTFFDASQVPGTLEIGGLQLSTL